VAGGLPARLARPGRHCRAHHLERRRPAGRGIRPDRRISVSSEYPPKFEFTGGEIIKVVFDVADDAYVDVERELTAAIARD
jgi:hypothetical protein